MPQLVELHHQPLGEGDRPADVGASVRVVADPGRERHQARPQLAPVVGVELPRDVERDLVDLAHDGAHLADDLHRLGVLLGADRACAGGRWVMRSSTVQDLLARRVVVRAERRRGQHGLQFHRPTEGRVRREHEAVVDALDTARRTSRTAAARRRHRAPAGQQKPADRCRDCAPDRARPDSAALRRRARRRPRGSGVGSAPRRHGPSSAPEPSCCSRSSASSAIGLAYGSPSSRPRACASAAVQRLDHGIDGRGSGATVRAATAGASARPWASARGVSTCVPPSPAW